jgi:hypothetical protein
MTYESKLMPLVFWVGFLALGFVTSYGGPAKTDQPKNALALDAARGSVPQRAQD